MTHNHFHSASVDLLEIAHRAMVENGFKPDLPVQVSEEVSKLRSETASSKTSSVRDLRQLQWSSIDDRTSRDLDQVEYVEVVANDDIRLLVGIADVDALVHKNSATDSHAFDNGTSVYTGVKTFPMLPEELSTDMTSLVGDTDRPAVVTEMTIGADGTVKSSDVYLALVHNYAKLAYESTGDWLDQKGSIPAELSRVPNMNKQIETQLDAAKRLRDLRRQHGALELETLQSSPVLNKEGELTSLTTIQHNSARMIIENFMIAANVAMAGFLEGMGITSLRRVVREPEQWPRIIEVAAELGEQLPAQPDSRALADFLARRRKADPDRFPDLSLSIVKLLGPGEYTVERPGAQGGGHFGLAVNDYTHSTAPNRRYADLITQRLVKAALADETTPYDEEQLKIVATHCTERDEAARKVERKMRKVVAAVVLSKRIGDRFNAIVTGVTPKGTFARTTVPVADGLVTRGKEGLRVGEKIEVRLESTDPNRGYIDFARL